MSSPFESLTGFGKPLKAEPPDAKELAGLCRFALVRLKDAEYQGLSLEGRFGLAYNAAHALCLAALRRHGYRSTNRYIVFQLLPHTLGLGPEVWHVLAKCHDVGNLGKYEGDFNVDERLVADLITACRKVAERLESLPPMNASTLVQKLWNCCNVLRDDGMSYGDYVEQLTYLLFLKMADERTKPPYNQESLVPAKYAWLALLGKSGEELAKRDKASLDIFWLRDEALADSDNLPAPEIIAQEIVDDLEAALEQFRLIASDLGAGTNAAG